MSERSLTLQFPKAFEYRSMPYDRIKIIFREGREPVVKLYNPHKPVKVAVSLSTCGIDIVPIE